MTVSTYFLDSDKYSLWSIDRAILQKMLSEITAVKKDRGFPSSMFMVCHIELYPDKIDFFYDNILTLRWDNKQSILISYFDLVMDVSDAYKDALKHIIDKMPLHVQYPVCFYWEPLK